MAVSVLVGKDWCGWFLVVRLGCVQVAELDYVLVRFVELLIVRMIFLELLIVRPQVEGR